MADASLYNATETPVLISNIEVFELLKKQQKKRLQHEVVLVAAQNTGEHGAGDTGGGDGGNNGRPLAKKHRRVRHRDWIEEKVMQYIQSTPCMQIANSNRPERHQLEKKLTSPPKKKSMSSSSSCSSESSTFKKTMMNTTDASTTTCSANIIGQQQQQHHHGFSGGSGYGLMPAEALQILNFMPTQLVEIHLMIEELNERMTEKQQEEFLKFMSDTIDSFQNNNNKGGYKHGPITTTSSNTTAAIAGSTAPFIATASSSTPAAGADATTAKNMRMKTEMTNPAMDKAMAVAPIVMVKQEPTN
jgi:RNA polymerase Rpb4